MRFLRDTAITFFARIVALASAFIAGIVVARFLGPEGKGVIAVLATLSGLAIQFGNFGIPNFNLYWSAKRPQNIRSLVGNSIWIGIGWGFVVAGVLLFISLAYPSMLAKGVGINLVLLTLISIPFLLLTMFFQNILLGEQRILLYGISHVAIQFLSALLIIGAIVLLRSGVVGAVWAMTLTAVGGGIFYVVLVGHRRISFVFDKEIFLHGITYGIRAAAASFFAFLVLRSALFFLNSLRGAEEAGFYSVALGFTDMLFILPSTIGLILFSRISQEISGRAELSAFIARFSAIAMVLGIFIFAIVGKFIIVLFYGEQFAPAYIPLLILLPALFWYSIANIFSSYFASRGFPLYAVLAWLWPLAIHLAFLFIAVPRWGMAGAAAVSSVTQFFILVLHLWYFKKDTALPLKKILFLQKEDVVKMKELTKWVGKKCALLPRHIFSGPQPPPMPASVVISLDYETWQPPSKEFSIDWEKDMFMPAGVWMDAAEKHGVPLTFFVEMGEYYWLKQYRPETAQKMEKQIQEMARGGHDIQLHLHPAWLPELGAKFENGEWIGLDTNQRLHDISIDIRKLFIKCKHDLEEIVREVKPSYTVKVFRAAKYQIQPSKEITSALLEVGIVADSSVWRGGYSAEHRFNFREAYQEHQPYPANPYNVNYLAPPGEQHILEIPIFSPNGSRWVLDNINPAQMLKPLLDYLAEYGYPAGGQWKFFLKKRAVPDSDHLVFTAIAHTKHSKSVEDLNEFFRALISLPFLRSVSMGEVMDTFYKSRENMEKDTWYKEHIKNQIDYDSHAILGNQRNWQQSFYAQEKIPLDRTKILDIGCGAGYWTKRLNDMIAPTVGVDVGDEFIAKAKKEYPAVEFHVMDFHNLQFPHESFDCVYADNILEHSPFPQNALSEIFRVLKDRGVLMALIPPDARNPAFSGSDHLWKTDKDEIELRLREVGFSGVKIEDINTKKLGIAPYKASNDSMLIVKAWKWNGGYNGFERVRDIGEFCYRKLDPSQNHTSQDPKEILKGGYAWCGGYVVVMKYLCRREGFETRSYTLFVKNHPKGRGLKKIDTHNVLEVKADGRWVLFDPLLNICFYASLAEILERPELTDGVLEDALKDARWREKEYELYCGRAFYGNIIKVISHDTGLRAIARRVKKFLWRKTS